MNENRKLHFPARRGSRNGGPTSRDAQLGGRPVDDPVRPGSFGDRVPRLGTAFLGATGETLVVVDLLSRGLDVFLPCRHSSPTDMIATHPCGRYWRIQAKARKRYRGRPILSTSSKKCRQALAQNDLLAVLWLPESTLEYYSIDPQRPQSLKSPWDWSALDSLRLPR